MSVEINSCSDYKISFVGFLCCIFRLKDDGAGTPYDKESTAIIKLNNTTVLYLKEVTKFLALVCFVREESFERKGIFTFYTIILLLHICEASS